MKICLDAGHFGKCNQSPCNRAYWESDFSWKFHLLLKAELEKYGITVITTRANQATDLALTARGKKAAGCDLFLSLHSNAIGSKPSATDYPLACCCVSGKCDELGQKLADTVQSVMGTSQAGQIIKKKSTSGNADWYGVLYGAAQVGTPGILLEHSFHTNQRATEWLLNDANLRRMAAAEAETIAAHYGLTKKSEAGTESSPASVQAAADGTFKVKVVCNALNVRAGAGTRFKVNTVVHKNEVYTIVQTSGNWGKLKSGAGWINISSAYCKKL